MKEDPTSGVVLRNVEEIDLSVFFEQQKDPAAVHMAAFTRKDPADWDAFVAHWIRILDDNTVTIRTILCHERVAGSFASFVDEQLGEPEVTYWIGREFWGKGIATRALL